MCASHVSVCAKTFRLYKGNRMQIVELCNSGIGIDCKRWNVVCVIGGNGINHSMVAAAEWYPTTNYKWKETCKNEPKIDTADAVGSLRNRLQRPNSFHYHYHNLFRLDMCAFFVLSSTKPWKMISIYYRCICSQKQHEVIISRPVRSYSFTISSFCRLIEVHIAALTS